MFHRLRQHGRSNFTVCFAAPINMKGKRVSALLTSKHIVQGCKKAPYKNMQMCGVPSMSNVRCDCVGDCRLMKISIDSCDVFLCSVYVWMHGIDSCSGNWPSFLLYCLYVRCQKYLWMQVVQAIEQTMLCSVVCGWRSVCCGRQSKEIGFRNSGIAEWTIGIAEWARFGTCGIAEWIIARSNLCFAYSSTTCKISNERGRDPCRHAAGWCNWSNSLERADRSVI